MAVQAFEPGGEILLIAEAQGLRHRPDVLLLQEQLFGALQQDTIAYLPEPLTGLFVEQVPEPISADADAPGQERKVTIQTGFLGEPLQGLLKQRMRLLRQQPQTLALSLRMQQGDMVSGEGGDRRQAWRRRRETGDRLPSACEQTQKKGAHVLAVSCDVQPIFTQTGMTGTEAFTEAATSNGGHAMAETTLVPLLESGTARMPMPHQFLGHIAAQTFVSVLPQQRHAVQVEQR